MVGWDGSSGGEWWGNDFTGVGQPKDQAHLGLAIVQGLEVEAGWSFLPPEV